MAATPAWGSGVCQEALACCCPQPQHRFTNAHWLRVACLARGRCADDDNDAVLFEKIKSGAYDADDPIWESVSDDAKDIVAKLLTVRAGGASSREPAPDPHTFAANA